MCCRERVWAPADPASSSARRLSLIQNPHPLQDDVQQTLAGASPMRVMRFKREHVAYIYAQNVHDSSSGGDGGFLDENIGAGERPTTRGELVPAQAWLTSDGGMDLASTASGRGFDQFAAARARGIIETYSDDLYSTPVTPAMLASLTPADHQDIRRRADGYEARDARAARDRALPTPSHSAVDGGMASWGDAAVADPAFMYMEDEEKQFSSVAKGGRHLLGDTAPPPPPAPRDATGGGRGGVFASPGRGGGNMGGGHHTQQGGDVRGPGGYHGPQGGQVQQHGSPGWAGQPRSGQGMRRDGPSQGPPTPWNGRDGPPGLSGGVQGRQPLGLDARGSPGSFGPSGSQGRGGPAPFERPAPQGRGGVEDRIGRPATGPDRNSWRQPPAASPPVASNPSQIARRGSGSGSGTPFSRPPEGAAPAPAPAPEHSPAPAPAPAPAPEHSPEPGPAPSAFFLAMQARANTNAAGAAGLPAEFVPGAAAKAQQEAPAYVQMVPSWPDGGNPPRFDNAQIQSIYPASGASAGSNTYSVKYSGQPGQQQAYYAMTPQQHYQQYQFNMQQQQAYYAHAQQQQLQHFGQQQHSFGQQQFGQQWTPQQQQGAAEQIPQQQAVASGMPQTFYPASMAVAPHGRTEEFAESDEEADGAAEGGEGRRASADGGVQRTSAGRGAKGGWTGEGGDRTSRGGRGGGRGGGSAPRRSSGRVEEGTPARGSAPPAPAPAPVVAPPPGPKTWALVASATPPAPPAEAAVAPKTGAPVARPAAPSKGPPAAPSTAAPTTLPPVPGTTTSKPATAAAPTPARRPAVSASNGGSPPTSGESRKEEKGESGGNRAPGGMRGGRGGRPAA
jgi:hypothetical protein